MRVAAKNADCVPDDLPIVRCVIRIVRSAFVKDYPTPAGKRKLAEQIKVWGRRRIILNKSGHSQLICRRG